MKALSALGAFVAAAAGLAGCSALAPYPTYPRPAPVGAKDTGPRVAICYDAAVNSGAAVQKAAQDECAPKTLATKVDAGWQLDYCPILLPSRATFVCEPKK